ncbi:MAG TPA: MFS transporter, partial [Herpetosiphonaceae bacterium]|nr:MFS transporter [Herpetosiphonaceae bacterium]
MTQTPESRDQTLRPPLLRLLSAPIWMGASYWWYFAALGCFLPYIALHYQRLGFSGIEIGVLTTIGPLAVALFAPLWGAIADTFGIHGALLRSGLALAGVLALLLIKAASFWPILLISLAFGASTASIPSLLDSHSVKIGAQHNVAYGQLRLWGSLGYSLGTWLIGWWMGGAVSHAFLIAYALAAFLACAATLGLPRFAVRSGTPFWHGISAVIRQPSMNVLLATLFLAAISTGIVFTYFGIYIDTLGGGADLVGTATALGAISELPVLFFGAVLLKRYGSLRMLIFALGLYCVRFGLCLLVPSAAWLLPLQLLHGLTFGMQLMASVTLAYELAGPERAATAQGLTGAVSYGLGAIIGGLAGGTLLDRFGITAAIQVATLLMVIAL